MNRITTVDDVLAIFEMSDQIVAAGNNSGALLASANDDLNGYYIGEHKTAARIWSDACRWYDRTHMSDADYCYQYDCTDF